DALRTLGEHHDSWEYIGRTLEGLGRVRKPLRRYLALYNASLFASSQELFEAALLFQDAAVREARQIGPEPTIEALTQRAAIFIKRKTYGPASADLREARHLIDEESDGSHKRWAEAEYDLIANDLPNQTAVTIPELHRALDFFAIAEPGAVPRLYLNL